MKYSTCCGAATNDWEYGICPECKDHTEFITEQEYCEQEGIIEDELPITEHLNQQRRELFGL